MDSVDAPARGRRAPLQSGLVSGASRAPFRHLQGAVLGVWAPSAGGGLGCYVGLPLQHPAAICGSAPSSVLGSQTHGMRQSAQESSRSQPLQAVTRVADDAGGGGGAHGGLPRPAHGAHTRTPNARTHKRAVGGVGGGLALGRHGTAGARHALAGRRGAAWPPSAAAVCPHPRQSPPVPAAFHICALAVRQAK